MPSTTHSRWLTLFLLATTTCQAAVIPLQMPDQHQPPPPPLPDLRSDQDAVAAAAFPNFYHTSNTDLPTTARVPMAAAFEDSLSVPAAAAAPGENLAPPPVLPVAVDFQPVDVAPQDELLYPTHNQGTVLGGVGSSDDVDPSRSSIDPDGNEEDEEDVDMFDEDEDDMLATNDEEGYLFHDDGDDEELTMMDPSTGMPAFRNKNDNDFNVLEEAPAAANGNGYAAGGDRIVAMVPPVDHTPPSASSSSSSSTSTSTSASLQQRRSFRLSDWRFLLAAAALLAVWRLATGKPRFMGASTRLSIADTVGPHLERRKQLIQKYELVAAGGRRIPIHTQDMPRKSPREFTSCVFPTIPEEDEEEAAAFDRSTRRASAGHIRRGPSPASAARTSGTTNLHHHARHISFSGKFSSS